MNDKLHELTNKLYAEGLAKGQLEADAILAKAKITANQLIADAEKKAQEIIIGAQKQAEEEKANAEAEIKLASRQVISEVKQTVAQLIITKAIAPETQKAFQDENFIKDLIKTITQHHQSKSGLDISVPEDQQEKLDRFIKSQVNLELAKGIEVKADAKLKLGFKIQAKEDTYYISFTDSDFNNLFNAYLRPKLAHLLFNK